MYARKQISPSVTQHLELGHAFGLTDIGNVRRTNEDNFLIDSELGLLAIADGMGGHEAGDIASSDGLTSLAFYLRAVADGAAPVSDFKPSPFALDDFDPLHEWDASSLQAMATLHAAVEYANHRVYQNNIANRRGAGGGMGTTLTGLWQPAQDGPLFVFHVGDTRLYRYRDGQLTQLTRDQTLYQRAIEAGIRRNLPGRNFLLQALGPSPSIVPDLQLEAVAPGDLFLLCSDGLHGACPEDIMGDILETVSPGKLAAPCRELINVAKKLGSRDNISAVLLQCKPAAGFYRM